MRTSKEVPSRPSSTRASLLKGLGKPLQVGLGETDAEILGVMRDLRTHYVNMLTIGRYLQSSGGHMPVRRYVNPDIFKMYRKEACKMSFVNALSGPMVRSSYNANQQAARAGIV